MATLKDSYEELQRLRKQRAAAFAELSLCSCMCGHVEKAREILCLKTGCSECDQGNVVTHVHTHKELPETD
jgi:hypothetical protein